MLETVGPYPFLRFTVSHHRALGDIIINAVNIRVSMMNDIVFEFPDESISPEHVQTEPHQIIDPGFFGVGAMAGIMHNIKADAASTNPNRPDSRMPGIMLNGLIVLSV
jgi:hypothetical protein